MSDKYVEAVTPKVFKDADDVKLALVNKTELVEGFEATLNATLNAK